MPNGHAVLLCKLLSFFYSMMAACFLLPASSANIYIRMQSFLQIPTITRTATATVTSPSTTIITSTTGTVTVTPVVTVTATA